MVINFFWNLIYFTQKKKKKKLLVCKKSLKIDFLNNFVKDMLIKQKYKN